MTLPDRARLALMFDPARLRADLAAIEATTWTDHFVRQNYEGQWDVLPLRHHAGATHPIMQATSPPDATEFVDAAILDNMPYFREVMAAFACPLKVVRLMRLTPGSRIKEHQDHDLAADWGQARLHIPITTNPGVTFLLNRVPVPMAPGEAWYVRLSDPHAVTNDGDTDRVHLVIDCATNDWLTLEIRAAAACQRSRRVEGASIRVGVVDCESNETGTSLCEPATPATCRADSIDIWEP